jgi:hypothetical protein
MYPHSISLLDPDPNPALECGFGSSNNFMKKCVPKFIILIGEVFREKLNMRA